MPTDFEERRARRIERLRAAAERAQRESDALLKRGHEMFDAIPFGQPILVGHYSEKADRAYRARASGAMEKGFERMNDAKDYADRADAAESNTAISGDDPDALDKIQEKIVALEAEQSEMKAINKAHAAFLRNPASLDASPLSEGIKSLIRNYKPEYSWLPHPIAPYQLTNNGANIRRLKERIKTLEARANDETTEAVIGDCRIVDSVEDNRLQVFFPGKPSEEVRSKLKANGFRWTPSVGCWQAYRGEYRKQIAEQIVNSQEKPSGGQNA